MANVKVKIATEGVFDRERVGAGSVVEVSEETLELNKSWMQPTDEPLNILPPSKKKAEKTEEK